MKYQNYYMGYIVAISVEICTVNHHNVSKRIIYAHSKVTLFTQ